MNNYTVRTYRENDTEYMERDINCESLRRSCYFNLKSAAFRNLYVPDYEDEILQMYANAFKQIRCWKILKVREPYYLVMKLDNEKINNTYFGKYNIYMISILKQLGRNILNKLYINAPITDIDIATEIF